MKFAVRWLLLAALSLCTSLAFAVTGTLSADGDTSAVNLPYPHLHLSGDFGGGTVVCKYDDDNGTPTPIIDGTFTAAVDVTFNFHRSTVVRCTLSDATAPALEWSIR